MSEHAPAEHTKGHTMKQNRRTAFLIASLAGAAGASLAQAQTKYELIKIDFPGASTHQDRWSSANGVNNQGQVVGAAVTGVGGGEVAVRAFVWQNGVQTMLPSSVAANPHLVTAADVNEAGVIAGTETFGPAGGGGMGGPGEHGTRLIVWDANNPGAAPRTFGHSHTSKQGVEDRAAAINDNGVVVGNVLVSVQIPQIPITGWQAWTLDVDVGQFEFLFDPSPISAHVGAADINNQGMVTGLYADPSSPIPWIFFTAYRWVNGERIALEPLPGPTNFGLANAGSGINEKGVIVGVSDDGGGGPAGAAMWVGTERTWLPTGAGRALSINESGAIVGFGGGGAFLLENNQVTWLSDLIPPGSEFTSLDGAAAINDEGWIVGSGTTGKDPLGVGFILKPLSETCYPDCNESGSLTVADFGCFQTRFVAGEPYADCNGDSSMTVADFGCFQTRFVAGCP